MDNVPSPTLADRLSTANVGICGVPHITLVNAHAERDGSTDLGHGVKRIVKHRVKILRTYNVHALGTVSTFLPLLERQVKNRRPVIPSVT